MKFTPFAVTVALATTAYGFAPQAAVPVNSRAASVTKPSSFIGGYPGAELSSSSCQSTSTSLNLFGFGASKTKRKLNSLAKVEGTPTEKEIRALFELWNSALATGDSRIVASRYTKVSTASISAMPGR